MTLALPPINRFTERMKSLDPNYGSQQHQRDMIERYDERQRRASCEHDHEHVEACYPKGLTEAVAKWQIDARKAPATPHPWRGLDQASPTRTQEHMVPWW